MHPLEQLALDVAEGRTDPVDGERAAAALAASGALGAAELVNWFRTAEWLARQEDLWERALLLGRLLAAAAEALPDTAATGEVARCRSAWTELVHLCVIHRPDGELFASGVRAGRAALDAARALGDDELAGQVLYRLGTLHLDPFSRAGELWAEEHRLWLSLGPRAALAGLPAPRDALRTAERCLREAAELRAGPGLGYTCKALAQALQQQRFLTGTDADAGQDSEAADPVAALCDRALALIPAEDVEARAGVEALRTGSGQGPAAARP